MTRKLGCCIPQKQLKSPSPSIIFLSSQFSFLSLLYFSFQATWSKAETSTTLSNSPQSIADLVRLQLRIQAGVPVLEQSPVQITLMLSTRARRITLEPFEQVFGVSVVNKLKNSSSEFARNEIKKEFSRIERSSQTRTRDQYRL